MSFSSLAQNKKNAIVNKFSRFEETGRSHNMKEVISAHIRNGRLILAVNLMLQYQSIFSPTENKQLLDEMVEQNKRIRGELQSIMSHAVP
jgi:hypothetical protein